MITLEINQAADRFPQIIGLVGEGEEVLVLDRNRPVARITRCESSEEVRPDVGTITSSPVICSEDCFAPMSDRELAEWGI
jgi:antitoxin (DNA-binding transcriptional repressor) of toxin-antitoxin stability system